MYQIKARGRLRSKNYLGRINLVRRYWHLKYSVRPCRRAGKSGVSRLQYLHALAGSFLQKNDRERESTTLYLLGRDVTRLRHWPTLFLQHPRLRLAPPERESGPDPNPSSDGYCDTLSCKLCEQPFVLNTSNSIATTSINMQNCKWETRLKIVLSVANSPVVRLIAPALKSSGRRHPVALANLTE